MKPHFSSTRRVIDEETGEVTHLRSVTVREGHEDPWCKSFRTLELKLCVDLKNMNSEFKVLIALHAQLQAIPEECHGWITVNQALLGKYCGMARSLVNRSMKKLLELGYLEQAQGNSRIGCWRVTPECAFKGSLIDYRAKYKSDEKINAFSVQGISF